jgi:hypothetical protein
MLRGLARQNDIKVESKLRLIPLLNPFGNFPTVELTITVSVLWHAMITYLNSDCKSEILNYAYKPKKKR